MQPKSINTLQRPLNAENPSVDSSCRAWPKKRRLCPRGSGWFACSQQCDMHAMCSNGNNLIRGVAALTALWGMEAVGSNAWRGSRTPPVRARLTIHSASIRTTAPLPSTGSSSRPPQLSQCLAS
ncbi:unnamed protein product [Prorocentrum cordatum]|uniref:Uncharacterized protein n=1 Tax=Prorocentrum cordatum TaxID=2364126 RepID=A0ABN9T4Y0_9DINO|nr:unnamed protein product [Polarella glacialis]